MGKTIPQQSYKEKSNIHGFILERIQVISELHSTAYIFKHQKTAARLLHLFNDDPNNLFSIAFRTPVYNSTGVPHILEHSVLCGSKKFPLKDPFQELLKGSLQTFLNALTYPDKTVYPVSSQVEKDYFNLVDVYCDAVFNPLLTENTFYQEGWHFDVEEIDGPVGIKGIVYNEMKGVYSNFSSHVDRKTLSSLFPDTTYFFESGGEPEHITDLNYQQFRDFHSSYYHPVNSFIFLYGNISSEKTLKFLNENYLAHFSEIPIDSSVKKQQLWDASRVLTIEAPAPKEDDGTATVALTWIFGDATDPLLTLAGKILTHYLLGTESSPLKRALVDSGLGEDLDDISGFDADLIQSVFAAGLRKCDPQNALQVENLILGTLREQVEHGLDKELLEGALRQVEFSLREVTGGHFPYNLRLAERCYRSWIYGGDPCAHLAFEKPLSSIKEKLAAGEPLFSDLIRTRLLNNSHRLRSTIIASSEMGKKLEQQTEKHAAELSADFTDSLKNKYHSLTQLLLQQQKTPPSEQALATLPKLLKSDLPRYEREVPTERNSIGNVPVYNHQLFTSGIVYLDIGFNLRSVPQHLLPYLPLYCELITRCGAAGNSYEKMAVRTALSTGGIDSSIICKTHIEQNDIFFHMFIHSKALQSRFGEMLDIVKDLLLCADLKNRKQIHDILLEERNGLHSSIIGSGHQFAITHAASFISPSRFIDEQLGGISQLRFLDNLVKTDSIDQIISSISELHKIIINRNGCVLSITSDNPSMVEAQLAELVKAVPGAELKPVIYNTQVTRPEKIMGIEISSAVNFVAQVWKTPKIEPASAGHMFLMSRYLSTGYLWDKVRVEGGAYGGMAAMSIANSIFSCASYRDPNLKSTFDNFLGGLKEIASGVSSSLVDQSVIGTIGKIDSPRTPHALGFGETMDLLVGNSKEFRQKLRDAVLDATPEHLKKSAENILQSTQWVQTVLGSEAAFDAAESQGLSINREQLIF
ncbi:MAG TPA: insulinase family protein [Chitinispirillaceae bacterium]|nr:insulinase family protein [Chitinispirillaceae bacterium]